MTPEEMALRLDSLALFRGLLDDPVVQALRQTLHAYTARRQPEGCAALAAAYGRFAAKLYETTDNWSGYLMNAVLQLETPYLRRACTEHGPGPLLEACLTEELHFFDQLASLTGAQLTEDCPTLAFLPRWNVSAIDFGRAYRQRLTDIAHCGYGIFYRYHVFTVEDSRLVPVRHPDPQRLSELPGYERERARVIANTEALLQGLPTNNVLLYGDAGTGKSSAIKAIANHYAPQGLRLVEVKKNQLYQIPDLMDELAANPLKFILFIDDLSFTANDDNFAALKAILEGSVGGRAKNIAVYATSNRRHLIKETLSDRTGDDIHEADTRQELMSLAARFGLTVTFQRPDKDRFTRIVSELAAQYGLDEPIDKLMVRAEAFAIRAGGRSPRVARQFVELVKAGVQ